MARPEGSKEEREKVRKRAINLLNNSYSPKKVAELADVSRQSVYRWKKSYKKEGMDGIEAKPNTGGRTPKLPKERLPELESLLIEGPQTHGFDRDNWSYLAVTELIEQEFGISVSASTARRYLTAIDWNDNQLSGDTQDESNEETIRSGSDKTYERVTIRIPKKQIEEVEHMVEAGKFPNRSEAIRAAVREMLSEQQKVSRDSTQKRRSWAEI